MTRKRFKLSHSLLGITVLLLIEGIVYGYAPLQIFREPFIIVLALIGGAGIVVIATEVIEEVRNAQHMLFLLSFVVFEFLVFFAFQYMFYLQTVPGSFQSLSTDPVSLLLQSVMVFVFNPLYAPETPGARALVLVNTLESLVLAFFVLQNIWQFRSRSFTESAK